MSYLTHQFANQKTLDRARRWLVQAGFDPSQIEAINEGVPRIAVRVGPGQAAVAGLIIDAAEMTDPEGFPSFWDLARQQPIRTRTESGSVSAIPEAAEPRTFVVAYHVPDDRPDLGTSVTAVVLRDAYFDRQVL
jgi:hypothetical protein